MAGLFSDSLDKYGSRSLSAALLLQSPPHSFPDFIFSPLKVSSLHSVLTDLTLDVELLLYDSLQVSGERGHFVFLTPWNLFKRAFLMWKQTPTRGPRICTTKQICARRLCELKESGICSSCDPQRLQGKKYQTKRSVTCTSQDPFCHFVRQTLYLNYVIFTLNFQCWASEKLSFLDKYNSRHLRCFTAARYNAENYFIPNHKQLKYVISK